MEASVPSRSVNFLVVASLLVPVIVPEGKNSLFEIFTSSSDTEIFFLSAFNFLNFKNVTYEKNIQS